MRHCLLTLLLMLPHFASADVIDAVVAVVDKEVILDSELVQATVVLQERVEAQHGSLPPDAMRTIRREALQGLIDEKLIQKIAKRFDLAASEEEIDAAVAGIAGDEGIDPEEIYAAAERQGLRRPVYRKQLGTQLTRMKVISSSVQSRVTVTDTEVEELYNQRYGGDVLTGMRIRMRHILLPWPAEVTDADKKLLMVEAQKIEKALDDGAPFPVVARQYSAAPSAQQGGMSDFTEGDLAPQIAFAVAALEPGERTSLLETAHGLNIFQMVERFDPSKVTLPQVADQIRAELTERKTLPEFTKWLTNLRESQHIEIVDPTLQ